MNLDLTGLAELARPTAGEPLMVPLDAISHDPDQPRKRFDEARLQELAESIRAIGVVQPISVRPDPATPGRYVINYGERRYRASMIAGMRAIPAFLHKTPDDYTQVAENLHRDDLSPMEMALFIKRRLDAGEKKYEIAAKLGYKNGYVTEHLALLEAPPCVEKAYANGATSARTLYDLRRLYDEFPQEVDAWCASGVEVTRDSVAALVQKFRRDEILDDVTETQVSSSSDGARDAGVTHDPVAAPGQEFRRDEILDDVPEMHLSTDSDDAPDGGAMCDLGAALAPKFRRDEIFDRVPKTHVSSGSDDARHGAATCDSGAALAQKFRRDEILLDAPGAGAYSGSDEARDVQVPRSVKHEGSPGPSEETRTKYTDCIGDKQAAAASSTGRSPARLLIRVQHDGRKATVQDESVVLIRYDDGHTAEVSLANTVVMGTAAA